MEIELSGHSVLIRLNRPERKNPLSVETLEQVKTAFAAYDSNDEIQQIVFTGSGDTFASGANLNEISSINGSNAREFALRGQGLMQLIYNSKKMTVAAINGYCMGGGLDLALSCKKRVAAPNAVFAHPGVNLGIITGWSGTQLLPRLIGEAKALELFLTGSKIGASEALRIGLIDKISENPLEDCKIPAGEFNQ